MIIRYETFSVGTSFGDVILRLNGADEGRRFLVHENVDAFLFLGCVNFQPLSCDNSFRQVKSD